VSNGVAFDADAIFDGTWLSTLSEADTSAYTTFATSIFDFLQTGQDSNPTDQYVGFAPLLLRTSFHSAGTFDCRAMSGGSNGGSIFHPAELEDDQNGCIPTATAALHQILADAPISPADAVVVAGVVALDVLGFPRMDLVKVEGGRKNWPDVAYRGRLPSADDDPLERFRDQYKLTPAELVALIGGGHEVGAAHAKCSGYVGAWTSDPLAWTNEFFPELMRTDWTWYEVCSYEDGTSNYAAMPDPFAAGADGEEEEEEEEEDGDACAIAESLEPLICEGQAMRGCAFEEGTYPSDAEPCPGVIFRLTSDFWLRENPELAPHAEAYAADAARFNEAFGKAYHKITHAGLGRCGMTGRACAPGSSCVETLDAAGAVLHEQCEPDGSLASKTTTKKKTTTDAGVVAAAVVSSAATLLLAGLVAFYACRRASRDEAPVEAKHVVPHEESKHTA